MVLVLVTGAVVEEDGSAWVWGRREGRHAPWAASSAALGVAILRGMNHYQGGCDPFIALGSWRRPRRVVRLCAQDGAVRGHRPWWAVWVWRWAVAVTFGVAALGVAVLRGMNYYQGGGDPNSLGFVASPPEDGAWAWWRRGSCDCGDCCARGDGGEDGEGGEGEGEGGGGGDGDGDGEGDGEGGGELAEASVDGGEWEVGVGACGRSVAWAAAHRAVGP